MSYLCLCFAIQCFPPLQQAQMAHPIFMYDELLLCIDRPRTIAVRQRNCKRQRC
jgi:hypothetical protein